MSRPAAFLDLQDDAQQPSNLFFQDLHPPQIDAQKSVIAWLSRQTASPPARLLYDAAGAHLFEHICQTPEYYLTRCEREILPKIPGVLAPYLGSHAHIIEYGSGNNAKISSLLKALPQLRHHIPIDISKDHLLLNAAELARAFPDRSFTAICADFFQALRLPPLPDGPAKAQNIGFFPGSTIGNMPEQTAIEFMTNARGALGQDCLFVLAVDRVKDPARLESAYRDEAGYSARFSLNLIDRINREMGGKLDKAAFRYDAIYNDATHAIEMYWTVERAHAASISETAIKFEEGERFLVEISRKFTIDAINSLAQTSGFELIELISDEQEWYSLALLRGRD